MSILDVPGAHLHYEVRGNGRPLVMIPGANGDARVFTTVADQLADQFMVVTYDRRGFSRSTLDGPQDYDQRLATDADDVRRLIEHVSNQPAAVFGTSSGGVVALEVLARHPPVVQTLLPYEPAAMRLLPNGEQWIRLLQQIYDLYRRRGVEPALETFRERLFPESDRQLMARATDPATAEPHVAANATYWFERELLNYTIIDLNLDALRPYADRIIPVVGRDSRRYPAYEVNVELAKQLDRTLHELPGGHVGYALHSAEFAGELLHAITP